MGRGLSELQRAILRAALQTRRETDPAIQARRSVDVYYYQILQIVHGWQRERPWSTYGPGRRHFSAASVGPARYNATRAALTRAVQRLEQRGLVERYVGLVARWAGVKLTPDGEALANRLLVNRGATVAAELTDTDGG